MKLIPHFSYRICPRFLCVLILALWSWPGIAQENAGSIKASPLSADVLQEAFVRAAKRIEPSVVTIYAERAPNIEADSQDQSTEKQTPAPSEPPLDQEDPNAENTSLGTGMVVDAQGAILTNYHVIKNATLIRVLLGADGERPQRLIARLMGFDEESDLAVLELSDRSALRGPLRAVEFADSNAVRVGEWAIAVGAPFDQTHSVTAGIISAKSRYLDKENRLSLQDYLQTDASINPGNSGGPLVNLDGKVIGVNTAILSPSRYNVGVGFAVPSNTARAYWPLLKNGKTIARGFLGVQYLPLDEEAARELKIAGGMQIGALAKRGDVYIGPAYAAGLKEGDIITHLNEIPITTIQEFRGVVSKLSPGTFIHCTILRPEDVQTPTRIVTIILGDWAAQNGNTTKLATTSSTPTTSSLLGFKLANVESLSPSERDALGVNPQTRSGAVIKTIAPGSPADIAQLRRGFIIEKARLSGGDWLLIPDTETFDKLQDSLMPGTRVLLLVRDKRAVVSYKLLTYQAPLTP